MHNLRSILVLCISMLVLSMSTAFAARENSTIITPTPALNTIHQLALKQINYSPAVESVAAHARDKHKELLTPQKLQDAFLEVAKNDKAPWKFVNATTPADAYVILTFSTNDPIAMFADVYAPNGTWLYSYKIIGHGPEDDNLVNYNMFFHKFLRTLNIDSTQKPVAKE